MPTSNGIISAPISIDDVNNTLGHGSTDLGTLCTSNKINKWSRYKPISVQQVAELTESQWKNYNYGWVIPSYSTRPEVWQAYVNGNGWSYSKPSSYFRLTDFIKYNHNSKSPFNVELNNTSPSIGTSISFEMSGIEDIKSWGYFSSISSSTLQFGILCSNGGYFPITGSTLTFDTIEWTKIQCSITSGDFTAGSSYTFCPVITTYTKVTPQAWNYLGQSDIGGTWWLMPVSELNATIVSNKTVMDYISVSNSTNSMTVTNKGSYLEYSRIDASITISLGSGYSGTSAITVSAILRYNNHYTSSGYEVLEIGRISSFSLTKGNSATKSIGSSVVVRSDLTKDDSQLNCQLHVSVTEGSSVYERDFSVVLDTTSWG